MADDKSFISAYCRPCQMPRYRSVKPLGRNDEARPELFKSLDPTLPDPVEGSANCPICSDRLVFMADNKLPALKKSEPVRNVPAPPSPNPEVFVSQNQDLPRGVEIPTPGLVETLFELGSGEELKAFQDQPDAFLVVTNKRIVRVKKG